MLAIVGTMNLRMLEAKSALRLKEATIQHKTAEIELLRTATRDLWVMSHERPRRCQGRGFSDMVRSRNAKILIPAPSGSLLLV